MKLNHASFLFIIIIITAFALLINAGDYGVTESSDARYAEIARAAYVNNDYIYPKLLNIHHYHKPPFTYQITALGYKLFGITPFGARFFLQLSVIIQIISVYLITAALFENKKTALRAAVIYTSYPLVLISSRNLTTDSFLTSFALLSIYSWILYRNKGKVLYLYLFAITAALGFYTKGPVIFIVPAVFIIGYNHITKPRNKFSVHHISAILLFLIIALWWFAFLAWQNPDFISYFSGKQTVSRFSENVFNRNEPFWYFIILAPLTGIPWMLILPGLIKINVKKIKKEKIYVVLAASILIPLMFFSASSSKRILYILPFYGISAVLTAGLYQNLTKKHIKIINKVIFIYSIVVTAAIITAYFIKTDFIIHKGIIAGVILMSALNTFIYFSGKIPFPEKPFAVTWILTLFLIIVASKIMSLNELKINSSKPVTDFILKHNLKNRKIIIYNARKPSIAFGLNKDIISIYDGNRDLNRETQFEKDLTWKNYLINIKNNEETEKLDSITDLPSVFLTYKQNPENKL
ncbi:MAG: glycosyltransferase family 39 protein, partial [Chlorobi bacterium]|nr:glycosyltransferase family 39 protein [Chlorobiota bacterium]